MPERGLLKLAERAAANRGLKASAFRAYLLFEVKPERRQHVRTTLLSRPGILTADLVEGPPDVVAITAAATFTGLLQQTIQAIAAVEEEVDTISCLPVRDTLGLIGGVAAMNQTEIQALRFALSPNMAEVHRIVRTLLALPPEQGGRVEEKDADLAFIAGVTFGLEHRTKAGSLLEGVVNKKWFDRSELGEAIRRATEGLERRLAEGDISSQS